MDEGWPGLARWAWRANLMEIFENRPFAHPPAQFAQLTPQPLRAPQPVFTSQPLDEGNPFVRQPMMAAFAFRFACPEVLEQLTMPAQQGIRLHNKQGLSPAGQFAGHQDHQ